jgi:hypothetical protein
LIQAKLSIGRPEVLQRQVIGDVVGEEMEPVLEGEEEEEATNNEEAMLKRESGTTASTAAPHTNIATRGDGGQPLEPGVRHFMEQRMDQDFSGVRIHRDAEAVQSARQLGALAYTVGPNIYFNSGQYEPQNFGGRRLLAHELTHVVQQGAAGKATNIGTVGWQMVQRVCPGDFCRPFPSRRAALADRDNPPDPVTDPLLALAGAVLGVYSKADVILGGIAFRVDARVVPLWRQHIFGGRGPQNLSATFGPDFASSGTTTRATDFLVRALTTELTLHPPRFTRRTSAVNVNMTRRIGAAIRELGDPASANQMNFNEIGTVPGNIAGGIGRDQLTVRAGARPSPFNDSRTAAVRVRVVRNPDGTLTLNPSITYTVRDTIDLCPGDCGADEEQLATVPISRWEASHISGDVPYLVRYRAPAITPVTVRPTPPPSSTPAAPPASP